MELQDAARTGWTSELRERFIQTYDRQIGRWILNLCLRYGLICSTGELGALRAHVEARLRGKARDSFSPLVDLLSDVYVRTYHEVFRERFVQRLTFHRGERPFAPTFESYLFRIVQHQFFAALGKDDLSEKELLDRMVQSRRLQTRENHLREVKARFWERARAALLCLPVLEPEPAERLCEEVHRHIDAITHYFFESFLPERYAGSRRDLDSLLEDFRRECYRAEGLPEEVRGYRARVPRRPEVRFVGEYELAAEEGVAS